MTICVTLTAFVLEEVRHKLEIVSSEPDLQEDYCISEEEAGAFYERMRSAQPGEHRFNETEAAILAGELQNAADIARSNRKATNDVRFTTWCNAFERVVQSIETQLPQS